MSETSIMEPRMHLKGPGDFCKEVEAITILEPTPYSVGSSVRIQTDGGEIFTCSMMGLVTMQMGSKCIGRRLIFK